MLGLNYKILWKAPYFYKQFINTERLFVDFLKRFTDMLMKYLYLRHVAKRGAFAVEMNEFLYHSYDTIQCIQCVIEHHIGTFSIIHQVPEL